MKIQSLIFLIFIAGLFGFCNDNNEVTVIGKILGDIPGKIEYTVPLNGICDWIPVDSVKPDSQGNFKFVVTTNKPVFVRLKISLKLQGLLIVEPGKNYEVLFDLKKEQNKFQVLGGNEAAQNQYNQLPNPVHIQLGAREYFKDSVASILQEKINAKRDKEIGIFKALYGEGKISKDFLELVQTDRMCYYAAVMATTVWVRQLMSTQNSKVKFSEDMKSLWAEIFQYPLFDKEYLSSSLWCYAYSESYIYFKDFINNDLTKEKQEEIRKANLWKTFQINEALKYLPSRLLESYTAIYLYLESMQKDYESELITLYDQFKRKYPESGFTSYLTPLINENIRFHKASEPAFSKKVKFVEGVQNCSDLKEAVKSLKGEKIFIDVWATWCGPCKEEFSHKEELNKLLASRGIKLLYISIDTDDKEKQWKDMIKFYNLEGVHLRANEKLVNDLRNLYGQNGTIAIPWYILLDENSNVVIRHAKSPSRLKELEKELNSF